MSFPVNGEGPIQVFLAGSGSSWTFDARYTGVRASLATGTGASKVAAMKAAIDALELILGTDSDTLVTLCPITFTNTPADLARV